MSSILGGIINAGTSLFSGLWNNSFNKTQRTRQNQWEEDMYNKYYSPGAQRRQLKAAGWSPLASDGQTPLSMPSSNSTAPSSMNVDTKLDAVSLQNLKVLKAQENQIKEETRGQKIANDEEDYRLKGYGQMWTLPDGGQTESAYVHELAYSALQRELNARGLDKDNEAKSIANDIANCTKEIQKSITKQQLNKLLEDIRLVKAQTKGQLNENEITKREAELARKYGISPHDQGWQGLIRILFANDTRIMNAVKGAWDSLTPQPQKNGGNHW